MMKPVWTQAIFAMLAGGLWATLPVGCSKDKLAMGQQNAGGQTSDANPAAGGSSGGATSAGGSIASGGNGKSGGATGAGGAVGAGGANASGGIIGLGGSGAGGATKSDAGCAPGWTMCCGQCLGPQAGICAPCTGAGGAGQTGGALGAGGGGGSDGGGAGGATDAATTEAAPGTCSALTTQAACDNRSDCHSVFVDANDCRCAAAGCCARFNSCANGGYANCSGQVSCGAKTPFCEGPYVVSYTSTCFEGCVRESECAGDDAAVTTPSCPLTAPANGSACGSSNLSCFYDNCPSTGRTQATCTGGTWSTQTAACGGVTCLGSPAVTTCLSGQLCLIVESGTIGVQCVNNTCGQGPISPACASGLAGCVVNATLTSGVTMTCNQCPQGGCA